MHLIETLGSGGAERLLHTNLRHLDTGGIESRVVTVFSRGDYWKEQIADLGVEVKSLDCSKFSDIFSGVSRLRRELKASKPDVIHTHLWTANVIGRIAGWLSGVPVISSIHNPEYEPEAAANSTRLVQSKIMAARLLDRFTSRWCGGIIAVSNLVRDSAVRRLGYPADKISVLYNPVDLSEIGDFMSRETLLAELVLPADSQLLLNVGRLSPQKGLIHAIRAIPAVLAQFPAAHLLSIGAKGDPAHLAVIEREIERLGISGSVHLLGERRNVKDYLHHCDIFVFPSEFEGLGIALAEAMAAGCPCVVSNIRPLSEFVIDGVNGILVEPGKPDHLSAKITELLGDEQLRKRLGNEARRTALELFDPQSAAQKLAQIYRTAAWL